MSISGSVRGSSPPKIDSKVRCRWCTELYDKRGIVSHELSCSEKNHRKDNGRSYGKPKYVYAESMMDTVWNAGPTCIF